MTDTFPYACPTCMGEAYDPRLPFEWRLCTEHSDETTGSEDILVTRKDGFGGGSEESEAQTNRAWAAFIRQKGTIRWKSRPRTLRKKE